MDDLCIFLWLFHSQIIQIISVWIYFKYWCLMSFKMSSFVYFHGSFVTQWVCLSHKMSLLYNGGPSAVETRPWSVSLTSETRERVEDTGSVYQQPAMAFVAFMTCTEPPFTSSCCSVWYQRCSVSKKDWNQMKEQTCQWSEVRIDQFSKLMSITITQIKWGNTFIFYFFNDYN